MALVFGILALAGVALFIRDNDRIRPFLALLLTIGTGYLMMPLITPVEQQYTFLGVMGALVALHFVLGNFVHRVWLKVALPVVSVAVLFLIGVDAGEYQGYQLDFGSPMVAGTLFLGWLIGGVMDLKKAVLKKWLPALDEQDLARAVQLITIGLFTVVATFFASWFGLLLLATGFYMHSSYVQHRYLGTVTALLALSSIGFFMQQYNVEAIDLSIGKVVAGLFIGAAAFSVIKLAEKGMPKWMSLVLVVGAILIVVLVLKLNNVHPAYGGIESFLAAIAGFAVAAVFADSSVTALVLFPVLVLIGLTLPNDPFAETESTEDAALTVNTTEKEEEKQTFESVKGMDASELRGDYAIDSKTAVISFQLGPKGGVTKGEIRQFEGSVQFGESIEQTRFEVTMPVKHLTTFNSMRDESLMEDIYFNEPKFPVMKFLSTKMTPKEDGYVLNGNFTLLGTTHPEEVFVKCSDNQDGNPVFVGKSAINKTRYGMASSPQEGDLVDFEFRIVLIK